AVYGTYRVTTDQTITAGPSLQTIPGLSWTLPANTALNVHFRCTIYYLQVTAAASDSFGIQDVTVAPTNFAGDALVFTSTNASTTPFGMNLTGINDASTHSFGSFTPSAPGTVFTAYINGTIEHPSNASTSIFQIMAQFTANNGTIKRDSTCQVF